MGWLFFVLPIAEVFVFIEVGERVGYFNALLALVASFFLGLLIIQSQGQAFLQRAQADLAKGEIPVRAVVHSLMIFIGGFLLLIPGFITDALALLFILPGLRHLLAATVSLRLLDKIKVFNFGSFGASGPPTSPESAPFVRDVSPVVIDVTPLPSEKERPPGSD